MQTCRAIIKNDQISFIDVGPFPVNDEQEHYVLVTFINNELKSMLVDDYDSDVIHAIANLRVHLSEREMEILQLVKLGFTNEQISDKLELSLGTVRNYLSSVYDKIKVSNRTGAIAKATELGLFE